MKTLRDIICTECGYKEERFCDTDYGMCPKCEHALSQDYRTLKCGFTAFKGSAYSATGQLQNFSCKHDPVTLMELGLMDDKGKYARIEPQKRAELRERYDIEGDSPKLHKDIVSEREKVGL